MSLSLNEIEAMAKKATRGAGFSWGLAEEAGKATRWLCAQDLDGCGDLAGLLCGPRHMRPQVSGGIWSGDALLCPLLTGAALSDFADCLRAGPLRLTALSHPLLLLPFAAAAARQVRAVITVASEGLSAQTDGDRLALTGNAPASCDLTLTLTGTMTSALPRVTRAAPDPKDWATLAGFASRTYAPASDASRHLGAGAGLSDND